MHSNFRLFPGDILCKITQRNSIRRANTCDPALKLINEEITYKNTNKHMEGALTRTLGSQTQHTHTLWKTIHTKHFHNIQQQNSNYTQTHCELFHQTIHKHCQTRNTNRHINRVTHNIQGYNIKLTTSQVQEAIKQSKNNNSHGPAKLNIRHLKYIGPLGLAFLTSMFNTALNKNIIPHTWKLANIVPIPKPHKDTDNGTSYRPISLVSVIADTGEEPSSLHNSKHTKHTHATRVQNTTLYSDDTTLHTLNNTVEKGYNQMAPPARTITVAFRYEQSFRHNKHTHTNKKAATDKHSRHNH